MGAQDIVVKYPTIAQSGTVSDAVDITGVRPIGVWVPTITSGQLLARASFDTTSANFVPLYDQAAAPIASRWFANVGPGSAAVGLETAAAAFPYVKLETSVAQADVRTLALICKLA